MKTIDERLKKLLQQPAPSDASGQPATSDEVDYNLLSRYAAGTADARDAARIAALKQQDPAMVDLVEEPGQTTGIVVQMRPRIARHVFRFLAAAASVVLVACIGWMVHSRTTRQHPRLAECREVYRENESLLQPEIRPEPAAAPTVAKAVPTPSVSIARKASVAPVAATRPPAAMKAATAGVPRYNTYALLIGVDRNEHDAGLRNGAVDDVRQVAAKLREFEFDQVVTLTNALATRERINGTLASLAGRAASNASLFVYCAGDAPDVGDLARNACVVPYDNALMDVRKNMQVEAQVTSAPSVFNNSFVVYDNRTSRTQAKTRQQIPSQAMNMVQQQAAPNVQVLLNVNTVQRNVSNVFARAFVEALDQASAGGSVSADDVQGYVARQQVESADMYQNGALLSGTAGKGGSPGDVAEANTVVFKDEDAAVPAASQTMKKEQVARDDSLTAARAAATVATAGAVQADRMRETTVVTNGVLFGVANSQMLRQVQYNQTLEAQQAPARQMFQFRRVQAAQQRQE